ncbi:MAG TPA: glycosyl hydrolase 115 family protein, partial [Oscillospiraceae bacterium]|nr:glycosyl hydrolase 115 family protein [Oscillospiraceae bacterium]
MDFVISRTALENGEEALFYQEKEAFSGVNKIAAKVMHDVELVFGVSPKATYDRKKLAKNSIVYGTIGHSPVLDELNEKKIINLSIIEGKREVYLFQVIDNPFEGVEKAVVIAGSDKRGTIYGLFHLSELLGVSPLVDWCDVKPKPKSVVYLSGNLKYISKEPSVRFRGFFINDEWPAFGNWTMKNFGGFNANMYDHVFELLLRLKGNYLWPAMWSSRFSDDGPGLASHELANEYGVIMGASHHEPCLRYGEEYRYLRGKDSIYGDAWNFRTNREGIIKFWEDGLKRSGKFENVITIGMRGEADTAIMGNDATLADNINLLRDVIKTQNRLIKECVNQNLSEVPRMLALYKEVEPFFYGDENTPGLMGYEELEDVIIMLCDDNHGNLRTLPTEKMRSHKGGYGMYYHFDYHGGPISYEWI